MTHAHLCRSFETQVVANNQRLVYPKVVIAHGSPDAVLTHLNSALHAGSPFVAADQPDLQRRLAQKKKQKINDIESLHLCLRINGIIEGEVHLWVFSGGRDFEKGYIKN